MKKICLFLFLLVLYANSAVAEETDNYPFSPKMMLFINNSDIHKFEEKEQKSRILFVYSKNPGDSEYYKLFIKSVEWTPILPGNDDPFFGFVTKADENFLLCISGISDLLVYRKDNPNWKLDAVIVSNKIALRLRIPF